MLPSLVPSLFRRLGALAAILASLVPALAEVVPAPFFTDHAVLQRDRPIPVWGTATPGQSVRVTFAGQRIDVVADDAGNFYGELPPLPALRSPGPLMFVGPNVVLVQNVAVGDIWVASGQSNMEWAVDRVNDGDLERLTARFPLIRHFKVEKNTADTPLETFKGVWVPATGDGLVRFSAVGWFFAREVHLATDVPIGIVNTSWGGTPVEAWMSPAMIQETVPAVLERRAKFVAEDLPRLEAEHAVALEKWRTAKAAAEAAGQPFTEREPRAPQGRNAPQRPAALFHAMVWPLRHLSPKGFIWYQGESNVGRAPEYHPLFSRMITGWRELFEVGDAPFYWVQLANFNGSGPRDLGYAELRAAQTATLALPNTGQAIAIDVGDADDIHPLNKLPVGRRLARLALARTYGFTSLPDSGPAYESHEVKPEGTPTVVVRFALSNRRLFHPDGVIGGFELAGEDKVFHSATATLRNNTIELVAPAVAAPVAIRYAWRNWNENARLSDEWGLPVAPFRTDTW